MQSNEFSSAVPSLQHFYCLVVFYSGQHSLTHLTALTAVNCGSSGSCDLGLKLSTSSEVRFQQHGGRLGSHKVRATGDVLLGLKLNVVRTNWTSLHLHLSSSTVVLVLSKGKMAIRQGYRLKPL